MRNPAMRHLAIRVFSAISLVLPLCLAGAAPACAWGDEGHEVIALIAQSFLTPGARKNVQAMLMADPDSLTAHTIAAAATWADKYRDANINGARQGTRLWHFVDLELTGPDMNRACFDHPPVPPGTPASNGPPQSCVVDKIEQFEAELTNPATDPSERIVALKFLLHLVGDEHQPLHASDNHDRGGNDRRVSAPDTKAGTLHHYWDTEFVERLGADPKQIAAALESRITGHDTQAWAQGGPADWAMELFRIARDDAYGKLPPPNARGGYRLTDEYVAMASQDTAVQLSKAGVRLAMILNRSFR